MELYFSVTLQSKIIKNGINQSIFKGCMKNKITSSGDVSFNLSRQNTSKISTHVAIPISYYDNHYDNGVVALERVLSMDQIELFDI